MDLIHCKKDTESMASMLLTVDQNTPGVIDKGERGENVGKMLLLTAYMNAVASEAGPNPPQWRKGCSLISFLKRRRTMKLSSTTVLILTSADPP